MGFASARYIEKSQQNHILQYHPSLKNSSSHVFCLRGKHVRSTTFHRLTFNEKTVQAAMEICYEAIACYVHAPYAHRQEYAL